MNFSYKKARRKLKYQVELKPFLIDPDEAKKLEEKLVEPKRRGGNFKRATRKMITRKTIRT